VACLAFGKKFRRGLCFEAGETAVFSSASEPSFTFAGMGAIDDSMITGLLYDLIWELVRKRKSGTIDVMVMRHLFALTCLAVSMVAECQDLPSLDVLLNRLDAYAKEYRATLPSLSCDEQITSQSLNKKGKIRHEVKVESTLREMRFEYDPNDPFVEKREFKSVDGHRPKAKFQTSNLPYFVEGGFSGLVGFKQWEQRDCFDDHVTSADGGRTVRMEMTLRTKPTNNSCAKLPAGFHRTVVADVETGRILHSERTIAPEAAAKNTEVYFGGIDYAPQKLGERTFWLPQRFDSHDAQNMGRMSVIYSNCHRYTGELKILP
jgi:hypothetical protein